MSTNRHLTILIIPGAFHRVSSFDFLIPLLQALDFSAVVASYPSLNPADPKSASSAADVHHIREKYLEPLVEKQGKDVLMLVHSYGGVAGGGAATGYSKATRLSQGKAGGIVGMVYITRNIVSEGKSTIEAVGGAYPPALKTNSPSPGLVSVAGAIPLFYADLEPSLAASLEADLLPHSMLALESPSSKPAWAEGAYSGRLAYLTCTLDACLPLVLQEGWIQESGVVWAVRKVQGSHTTYVSKAKEVAGFVAEFAELWLKT